MSAERVEDLLSVYLAARGTPRERPVEELCGGCPELLPELRRRIASAAFGDGLLRAGADPDATRDRSDASSVRADAHTASRAPSGGPTGPTFAAPTAPGEVGTLGPYRIVKELGHGGMGAVYLAFDARLKRRVALKVMLPQSAADGAAKERFLREAQTAAQISHDNVVTIHEADERDGVPYIAMQFLEGVPLDQFLKRTPRLTASQVLRIAREAAAGLAAAHRIGLVHRDVKPANLWLEAPGGRVKVLDFGLARPVHAEHELTQSGAVVGTPAYMSPEQARGEKVDARTDLFSLGAVMYRLCAGKLPFGGASTMAVLMALGHDDPTPVRGLNPEVPESLASLIHQLLAKKPEQRPQTAAEVVARLGAIAQERAAARPADLSASHPQVVPLAVAAPEASPFADLDSPKTEADAPEPAAPPVPKPERKKGGKGLLFAVGGAVLLAGVAVAVVVSQMGKKGEPTAEQKPPETTPAAPAPPRDAPAARPAAYPDRAAAEWVLSVGGSVWVNGVERDIKAAADLPRTWFTLTGVILDGKPVTDVDVVNLKNLKALTHLGLRNTAITDAGLAHLKELNALIFLSLNSTQVTDLVHLEGLKRLNLLDLNDTGVTDVGLTHLKELKALTRLDLAGTKVTDTGLTHLKELEALKSLDLWNTQVTDTGLAHLKELKALAILSLGVTQVSDAGLVQLKELKTLTSLNLMKTKVTAKGLEELTTALPGCQLHHDGGVIEPKK